MCCIFFSQTLNPPFQADPALQPLVYDENEAISSIGIKTLFYKECCEKCCSSTGVYLPTCILSVVSYKTKISLLAYTILNIYPNLFLTLGMYYYGGKIGSCTGALLDKYCSQQETSHGI